MRCLAPSSFGYCSAGSIEPKRDSGVQSSDGTVVRPHTVSASPSAIALSIRAKDGVGASSCDELTNGPYGPIHRRLARCRAASGPSTGWFRLDTDWHMPRDRLDSIRTEGSDLLSLTVSLERPLMSDGVW